MERGKAPVKTAVLNALNVIQWCLYYPGVLDLKDLEFTAEEQRTLEHPWPSIRRAICRGLWESVPCHTVRSLSASGSTSPRSCSVPDVDEAEFLLSERPGPGGPLDSDGAERLERLANALRTMVAAVKAGFRRTVSGCSSRKENGDGMAGHLLPPASVLSPDGGAEGGPSSRRIVPGICVRLGAGGGA